MNLVMAEPKSPTNISVNCVKKSKYNKSKSLQQQILLLANVYLRHGSKANRHKQVQRLIKAVEAAGIKYNLTDVRQIGKRQVHWFDEQLRQQLRTSKTRMNYWRSWNLLWEWLDYRGQPPRPRV